MLSQSNEFTLKCEGISNYYKIFTRHAQSLLAFTEVSNQVVLIILPGYLGLGNFELLMALKCYDISCMKLHTKEMH